MFRITALIASAVGSLFAAPAAAQSLTLVNLPVVYVASPVVQETHQGKAIAPKAVSRPAAKPQTETKQLAAMRPQAHAPAAHVHALRYAACAAGDSGHSSSAIII